MHIASRGRENGRSYPGRRQRGTSEDPGVEINLPHAHSYAPVESAIAIPQLPVEVAIATSPRRREFPDSYQIFSIVPTPSRRLPPFFLSLILHCGFVFLLGQGLDLLNNATAEPIPHESFLVLQLTLPTKSLSARTSSSAVLFDPAPKRMHGEEAAAADQAAKSSPAETAEGSEKRSFQLPEASSKAEYTLVQRDVRPRVLPKASIRVPEAIAWSAQELAARSPIVPGAELGAKLPSALLSLDLPQPAAKVPTRHEPAVAPAAPPQIPPERTLTAPVKMSTPDEGNRIPESLSRMSPEKTPGI